MASQLVHVTLGKIQDNVNMEKIVNLHTKTIMVEMLLIMMKVELIMAVLP